VKENDSSAAVLGSWDTIGKWPFPWVPILVNKIRERRLPKVETQNVWVGSDYSGAQRGCRFLTLGVLIGNAGDSRDWELQRVAVRERFLRDGRRMSFKALNDSQRRAALVPFLQAADAIDGISVVFAIDRRIRYFGGFSEFQQGLKQRGILLGDWKPRSFERMVLVTHLISVLLALVTADGQSITWISDADDSFATDIHKRDTAKMMSIFSSLYVSHKLGTLSLGTTDLDEGDRFEEDLTAIPDLSAGAIGELFEKISTENGKIPAVDHLGPKSLSRKSDLITSWFFYPNKKHRKLACVIQKVAEGHLQIGTMWEDHQFDSLSLSV
jgi:hypothetical protein